MGYYPLVARIAPPIMRPTFNIDAGCCLQWLRIVKTAYPLPILIHTLTILGWRLIGRRVLVYHKIPDQSSITGIRWDFGRDHCINVCRCNTVAPEFEKNMSMGKATFLELNRVDAVQ